MYTVSYADMTSEGNAVVRRTLKGKLKLTQDGWLCVGLEKVAFMRGPGRYFVPTDGDFYEVNEIVIKRS